MSFQVQSYQSPSLQRDQTLSPQIHTESVIELNMQNLMINYDGIELDYQNQSINQEGLWINNPYDNENIKADLPLEILLKFDHRYFMNKYCCELVKSLCRMTHSAFIAFQKHRKNIQTKNQPPLISLKHCCPIISRIPPRAKYITDVLKKIKAQKIELLIQDTDVFMQLYKICYLATYPTQDKKILLQKNTTAKNTISSIKVQQIAEQYKISYQRIHFLVKAFEINSSLTSFFTDLNMYLVSQQINIGFNDMLQIPSVNIHRQKKIKSSIGINYIKIFIENLIKIVQTTFACVSQSKKSIMVLKQILLVDELHEWISEHIGNIAKYYTTRKLFINLLGYFSVVNRQFVEQTYYQHQQIFIGIIIQQISKLYGNKNSASKQKSDDSVIESLLLIVQQLLLLNNSKSSPSGKSQNRKSLSLLIISIFLQYFQWLGSRQLQIILIAIKIETSEQLLTHLAKQIINYITNFSEINFRSQWRNNKFRIIEIFKCSQYLHELGKLPEQIYQKLSHIVESIKNPVLANIFKTMIKFQASKIPMNSKDFD